MKITPGIYHSSSKGSQNAQQTLIKTHDAQWVWKYCAARLSPRQSEKSRHCGVALVQQQGCHPEECTVTFTSPCHESWESLPLPSTAFQNPWLLEQIWLLLVLPTSHRRLPGSIRCSFPHTSPDGSPPFYCGVMNGLDHMKAELKVVLFSLYLHTRFIQHFYFIHFSV